MRKIYLLALIMATFFSFSSFASELREFNKVKAAIDFLADTCSKQGVKLQNMHMSPQISEKETYSVPVKISTSLSYDDLIKISSDLNSFNFENATFELETVEMRENDETNETGKYRIDLGFLIRVGFENLVSQKKANLAIISAIKSVKKYSTIINEKTSKNIDNDIFICTTRISKEGFIQFFGRSKIFSAPMIFGQKLLSQGNFKKMRLNNISETKLFGNNAFLFDMSAKVK